MIHRSRVSFLYLTRSYSIDHFLSLKSTWTVRYRKTMSITETTYPPSPSTIDSSSGSPTFLIFYSDVQDGRMWCPVRTLPSLCYYICTGNRLGNLTPVFLYYSTVEMWKGSSNQPFKVDQNLVRSFSGVICLRTSSASLFCWLCVDHVGGIITYIGNYTQYANYQGRSRTNRSSVYWPPLWLIPK